MKVKCRICGKEFKQITYDHLEHKHNMNLDEYKELYPDDNLVPNRTRQIYVKYVNRPKIKCEICGKEYYRISNSHMQRIHQIDLEDYKEMFPDAKLFIVTEDEKRLISKNHANVSGERNPFYGKHWDEEMKNHLSNKIRELWKDEEYRKHMLKHIQTDGKSQQPYEYNSDFRYNKKLVFKLYGKICNLCGSKKNICCHHIDYHKDNNNYKNLIPLCRSCHGKTNFNRDIWQRIFELNIYLKPKEYFDYIESTLDLQEEELPFL